LASGWGYIWVGDKVRKNFLNMMAMLAGADRRRGKFQTL
jgi:hypothetical protein